MSDPQPTVAATEGSTDHAPGPPTLSAPPGEGPFVATVRVACGGRFGDYELLQEVGRGGMGVVFKARQVSLDRVVALKMILPGSLPGEEDLQRFRTEAEATARLNHPHIVTVHEVGAIDGQHFYSMDYIDGPSLAQRLADGPLPSRGAARYAHCIARAIHHAHLHQVLHRDLKPSNILLDGDDEPHVTDFGLAKKLGGDSARTRTGAILGTPSYMSPEQAAGKTREIGPPCDVYGVGALLYELLTGRPPFRSDTPLDTLMHVLDRDPAPPRLLNAKVDRDLELICLKCLEKDPRLRYQSADALARDLQRYLDGEAISVRGFNVLDRLTRTLERGGFDVEFREWGTMLLFFAAVILAAQVVMFFLTWQRTDFPVAAMAGVRVAEIVLLGGVFWRFRSGRVAPASAAERQLWSIWIGYLVASTVVAAGRLLTLRRPEIAMQSELTLYPVWSVLTGLAFVTMGSSYWGRCYVYGALFFVLGVVMRFHLDWSPLEFGALWAACLLDLGLRLRRLGRKEESCRKDEG